MEKRCDTPNDRGFTSKKFAVEAGPAQYINRADLTQSRFSSTQVTQVTFARQNCNLPLCHKKVFALLLASLFASDTSASQTNRTVNSPRQECILSVKLQGVPEQSREAMKITVRDCYGRAVQAIESGAGDIPRFRVDLDGASVEWRDKKGNVLPGRLEIGPDKLAKAASNENGTLTVTPLVHQLLISILAEKREKPFADYILSSDIVPSLRVCPNGKDTHLDRSQIKELVGAGKLVVELSQSQSSDLKARLIEQLPELKGLRFWVIAIAAQADLVAKLKLGQPQVDLRWTAHGRPRPGASLVSLKPLQLTSELTLQDVMSISPIVLPQFFALYRPEPDATTFPDRVTIPGVEEYMLRRVDSTANELHSFFDLATGDPVMITLWGDGEYELVRCRAATGKGRASRRWEPIEVLKDFKFNLQPSTYNTIKIPPIVRLSFELSVVDSSGKEIHDCSYRILGRGRVKQSGKVGFGARITLDPLLARRVAIGEKVVMTVSRVGFKSSSIALTKELLGSKEATLALSLSSEDPQPYSPRSNSRPSPEPLASGQSAGQGQDPVEKALRLSPVKAYLAFRDSRGEGLNAWVEMRMNVKASVHSGASVEDLRRWYSAAHARRAANNASGSEVGSTREVISREGRSRYRVLRSDSKLIPLEGVGQYRIIDGKLAVETLPGGVYQGMVRGFGLVPRYFELRVPLDAANPSRNTKPIRKVVPVSSVLIALLPSAELAPNRRQLLRVSRAIERSSANQSYTRPDISLYHEKLLRISFDHALSTSTDDSLRGKLALCFLGESTHWMLPNSKHVATYPKRMVFALDADVPRFVDIRPVRDVIDVSNMSTPPSSVFGSEFFSSRLRTRLRTAKPGADIGLQLTVEHLAKNARLAKGISIDHLGDKLFSSKELERKDSKIWIVGGKHKNH